MLNREDIEFRTLDGVALRGFLYPAPAKGPSIVMTPGFNFPISPLYHEVARVFQESGITALLYDPRTIGISDGLPRSDIDPTKQAEDMSDAVTFLKTKPTVDPKRIALWGYSLSGAAALAAADLDQRVKSVVAVCPAPIPFNVETSGRRKRYLDLAIRDRESQARGKDPFYVQYVSDSEDTAIFDYRMQTGMGDMEYDEVMTSLKASIPNFRNEVTVQTISRLVAWSAAWASDQIPKSIANKAVLQIYATHEEYEHMKKTQEQIWNGLTGPKEKHYADGGHMNILSPEWEGFAQLVKVQADFVHKYAA